MKLSNRELFFIQQAAKLVDAVFDYENYNEDEFEKYYGMTKHHARVMADNLSHKAFLELERMRDNEMKAKYKKLSKK